MIAADPPVRKDGKCACDCGKTRPIVAADTKLQRRLRRYAGGQAESDPFASTECARRYHGCELAGYADLTPEQLEARAASGRMGKVAGWRGGVEYEDPVLA